METLIIKYSLGAVFLGATLIFLAKIGILLGTYASLKVAMLQTYIHSHSALEILKGLIN